ncbi:class I SAM-dependent methyltransferase [Fundicoccus sp. Sow4_H7]|uniref:class I SAM-dependent methyltransferase n=1 Tax=Fundicoccus sp. Sow4_H7 TaxID=3438784 RepID=UPI003F9179DD
MGEQYFTRIPTSEDRQNEFTVEVAGYPLKFITSEGVFSKNRVDYGSKFLVESFIDLAQVKEGQGILEFGSGYGAMLIPLAKAYDKHSLKGFEVNERAYALALKNATLNQVQAEFVLADIMTVSVDNEAADFVLTNPPIRAGKAVIRHFVDQAFKALKTEGELWLVIQKKQGAPSMQSYMETVFGNVEKLKQDKGYWILKSQK